MAKWLEFVDAGTSKSGTTRIWVVKNRQYGTPLGEVRWDAGWRRYVFIPERGTIFEQDCLRDLAAFIEDETAAHKRRRAAAKAEGGS